MKYLIAGLMLANFISGCAFNRVYDPLNSATHQVFLLNESALAQVSAGMKEDQVHRVMGESIIIGYNSQKSLTISNPYKIEDLNLSKDSYRVEYYISRVNQADGIVNDDELTPLVFHQGILVGKGWDYLKTLRLKNPS